MSQAACDNPGPKLGRSATLREIGNLSESWTLGTQNFVKRAGPALSSTGFLASRSDAKNAFPALLLGARKPIASSYQLITSTSKYLYIFVN